MTDKRYSISVYHRLFDWNQVGYTLYPLGADGKIVTREVPGAFMVKQGRRVPKRVMVKAYESPPRYKTADAARAAAERKIAKLTKDEQQP